MADLCDKCKTGIALKRMAEEQGLTWMKIHIIQSGRLMKPCLKCQYSDAQGIMEFRAKFRLIKLRDNFREA